MASPKNLRLKLLVDKEKKRVLFAESDKDFVDILFSFLTMPVGTIIRLLNKQACLGCMDKLYESIENLKDMYFNTEACKVMLLNPLHACRSHYTDLVLRIDDSEPRSIYTCRNNECRTKSFPFFSSVPKARCRCGEIMDSGWYWRKEEWKGPNGDGVFVKGTANFLITDDLHVMPASNTATLNAFEKLAIKDLGSLEETAIDLDVDKVSKEVSGGYAKKEVKFMITDELEVTPFSSLGSVQTVKKQDVAFFSLEEKEIDVGEFESYNFATMASPKKLRLKLLVDKEKKRAVFAESHKDFVDILFSFLTMPIGAIIRMLNKQSSLGCMDKLYESIENLNDVYFNTEACKVMLLNPLNACRSHYHYLVLRIDDSEPESFYTCRKNECRTKSFPFFSSVPKARCGCGKIMDLGRCWQKGRMEMA